MPELAEVEYYRKQWDCGLNQKVLDLDLHGEKRIFRGLDLACLEKSLRGATLRRSESRGKQLLFCFSRNVWLGLHLGMTGKLRAEPVGFQPLKHDHLILKQQKQTLVFSDPRLFGRVLFHVGSIIPEWWSKLPAGVLSSGFTLAGMRTYLERHKKAPIKAVLLSQKFFPGLGNWMVDEILWRAKIHPGTRGAHLSEEAIKTLFKQIRFVSKGAMATVGEDYSDLPAGWLFHERWKSAGHCPGGHGVLRKDTIGGRTTAWCRICQKPLSNSRSSGKLRGARKGTG